MIQDQQNQMGSTFYKLLPQAKPISKRLPLQFTSVFQYPQSQKLNHLNQYQKQYQKNQQQPLQINSKQQPKKQIHQIGQQVTNIFTKHLTIYKFHQNINTDQNDLIGRTDLIVQQSTKIYFPQNIQKNTTNLIFDSRFESGNLALAAQSLENKNQYYLAIHKDLNSKQLSSSQWFYFSVENQQLIGNYTFHIINYVKSFSAFQTQGMKPCIFSQKNSKNWERGGQNIKYRKNTIQKSDGKHYYTLTFDYQFKIKNDKVYFAYCYPYTQKRLYNFLDKMDQIYPGAMHRKVIAKSLGGNPIQMISITNNNYRSKKVIFISARVHPGQTVSSYVCEGFIQFLLGNSQQAQKLKTQFIIRIFPMMNPDGVVNGNYRASLSGEDLNRQWQNPIKQKYPQIFAVKKTIIEIPYEKLLFIDLHGHSRKRSAFMYGCFDKKNPYLSRQFPYILSKKSSNFNYYNCNFSTPKHKQGTSRISIWKQLKLLYSYTLQTSFCCASRSKVHFSMKDFENIGKQLCQVTSLYFCKRKPQKDVQVQVILGGFYNNQDLLEVGQQDSDGSSTDSQKSPENYNIQLIDQNVDLNQFNKNQLDLQENTSNSLRNEAAYLPPHQRKRYFYVQKQMRKTVKQQVPQPILKHRQFGQKLKIQQLQLDPDQKNNFEVFSRKRVHQNQSRIYRVDSSIRYSPSQQLSNIFNPSFSFKPTTSRNIGGTRDFSSALFPQVVKNQYTKYQKYKKQQFQIKAYGSTLRRHNRNTDKVYIKNTNSVDIIVKQKIQSPRFISSNNTNNGNIARYGNKQITLLQKISNSNTNAETSVGYYTKRPRASSNVSYNSSNVNNSIDNRYTKYIRSRLLKD